MTDILIKPALIQDRYAMWEIFHKVVQTGDTYVYPPNMTRAEFETSWFTPEIKQYIARSPGTHTVVGMYILKPNFPGLGSHVANASFMVSPDAQGKGVGKAMGRHALAEAKALGYEAMQFNIVVSNNTKAVKLWESLGFNVIGTSPKAFRHQAQGLVDTHIMHRFLND